MQQQQQQISSVSLSQHHPNQISLTNHNNQLNVTNRIRKHLIKRLIATILSPSSDLNDLNIVDLIRYGKSIENKIYQKSQSKEEYFHLLAEYIYKTQKLLKIKQRENYDFLIKNSLNFELKNNSRE
jgi:hypothetical protein